MRAALAAAALLVTTAARADFERDARNVFVFEGIAGAASYRVSYPESNREPNSVLHTGALGMLPFSRLGYHRFLRHGISVGLGAQFLTARTTLYYDRDSLVFGVAPRLGYSTPISRLVSFWIRVGPGLVYTASETRKTGQWSAAGEAILVFIPARDFGLTATAFLDAGFAGRELIESTNTSRPIRYRTIGLSLGLAMAF